MRHVAAVMGQHALAAIEHRSGAAVFDPSRRPRRAELAMLLGTKWHGDFAARFQILFQGAITVVPPVKAALAPEQAGADQHRLPR